MSAMGRSGISKVVLKKEGEFELQLERQGDSIFERASFSRGDLEEYQNPLPVTRHQEPLFTPNQIHTPAGIPSPAYDEGKFVTSPMVGTYYATPSPDDPVFVKVGDKIDPNTVVCIVEAMKVMNEVKAGISGTVAEILITNGHPVEFGTKLLRIV